MLDTIVPTPFEYMPKANEVAVNIGEWIFQ